MAFNVLSRLSTNRLFPIFHRLLRALCRSSDAGLDRTKQPPIPQVTNLF